MSDSPDLSAIIDIRMLRDSASAYFGEADPIPSLRRQRAARDLVGLARGAWDGMVELGLAGIVVPEAFGGAGLDFSASIHIAEMMGQTLAAGPFVSTAIMAATAIAGGGEERLKSALLPRIAGGTVVALAVDEANRHRPDAIASVARPDGSGYRVSGRKVAVIDGNIAELLIVAALVGEGLGLFVIPANAPGVTVRTGLGVDSRPAVEIQLDDVPASDLICPPERGAALLDEVLDAGRLHLAAEMLGLAQEAFDRTLDYMKTRVQFGRKIGEFQALQHRAALLFGELEIGRSVVYQASNAKGTRLAEQASLAKAKLGEVAKHVTTEAVQLHGGIGVTDEFDIGLYLKRARAASELLGDWAFHTERYARLQGM